MAKSKQLKFSTNDVKDICFPVEKIESNIDSNDYCNYDIIVYPKEFQKGRRVASCADRYELISNENVFQYFETLLKEAKIEYEVKYEMTNYAIFTGSFNLFSKDGKSLEFKINDGDAIYPQIKIRHSYNSQAKYGFIFGYYRMICANGLTVPVREMDDYNFSVTGKHTKFFHENFNLLEEKIETFLNAQKTFLPRIKELVNNTYVKNWADRVEEVLKATGIATHSVGEAKKNRGENVLIISNMASFESTNLDMPVSDWLIYNAINSFLYDDSCNVKTDETRSTTDSKVMEYMLKTV